MSIKKSIYSLFFVGVMGLSGNAISAVYESNHDFSPEHEILYSIWVQEKVSHDIFSNPNSPYYGIKTDCADAAFALRAIFAYEQKLSIEFRDNDGQIISEKTKRFDLVTNDELKKLKSFIAYIGENSGSEVLARDNTYPIALKSIRPGDLYITRWINSKGEDTRHVYIIKEVLPTGDFVLFSSTQPRAIRPLLSRKGMPLHLFKERPFGFRRFIEKSNSRENESLEQYQLVKLGESRFFGMVKDGLKIKEDTLQLNIERRIENICLALKTRKDVVDLALQEKGVLTKKCFTNLQYEEYSTPSRDNNIIQDIERLRNGFKSIIRSNQINELNSETILSLENLIGENNSTEAFNSMAQLCSIPIELTSKRPIKVNIKSFYDRFKAGLISSNPNELIDARWGFEKESKQCLVK